MLEHEYDDAGRLIRSVATREPLFTEQDRAELLALALYREGLCPACSGPLSECTSHEATGPKFIPSWVYCRRTETVLAAKGTISDSQRPGAMVWSTTMTKRR